MTQPRFTIALAAKTMADDDLGELIKRSQRDKGKYDVVVCEFPPDWFPTPQEPIPTEPTLPIVQAVYRGLSVLTAQAIATGFNHGAQRQRLYAVAVPTVAH